MTRKEYMDLLSRALENVEPEVARDIMEDYEAHFERAKESGRSEGDVIAELGSIEEFEEELHAFMTGKNVPGKKEGAGKEPEHDVRPDTGSTADPDPLSRKREEANRTTADPSEEECLHKREEMNPGQGDMQPESRELERAREEMKRACEEMLHAKEELERAKRESERAAKEMAQMDGQRAAKEEQKRAEYRNYTQEVDVDNIISSAKNITNSVLNQVSGALNKAFSGFGDWMGNQFERSGEDMADYRRRQENARAEAEGYRRERSADGGQSMRKDGGMASKYSYSNDYDTDDAGEQYMPESRGIVTKEEGIRHIVLDSKAADVAIAASEDNNFSYHYINEGSTGSKILYRCERRVSQGILTLSIVRDEKAGRKNHFSILGGVFEENADLRMELFLPAWVEALEVNGKSGDINMKDTAVSTLMLKSMSGDVTLSRVNAGKCMAETMSGDVTIRDGQFGYVLASTKSGDARAVNVKAEKAAFKSMSGDADVQGVWFGEAAISSMSGDARAAGIGGRIVSVSSMSGDAYVKKMEAKDAKVSSMSGDARAEDAVSDNLLMTVASGDLEGSGLAVKILKASAVSGDMSIRGGIGQMNLTSGSGDVIVVQEGDTKASVNTRSGEVHFHLKNNGAGFAAKVSTHGETSYRYHDLHLREAANGIHRYGAEGSSLEIKSTSGDISVTD